MEKVSMKRSNIRFDKNVHNDIKRLYDVEGFDNYISTVKFLIRFAVLMTQKWNVNELPLLTYTERIEKTIPFHPKMIQSIESFDLSSSKPLSRNDKINYLCLIGLQEYEAAVKRKEDEGSC